MADPHAPANDVAGRVSVVLLTFNCAHRLRPVLEQLGTLDVPLIAVDNASTDGTRALLDEFSAVEVIALPRNIGAAARNAGCERATTPYVAFCDDDGWYEGDALRRAADLLDAHPRLAVVNARILVGRDGELDPISAEMARSPLPDAHGIPGAVLLGFMAGAVIVRRSAYLEVGGYDEEFFIGGEEETLAVKFARRGWQMRYVPGVVVHHAPSQANAPHLRAHGMRNTLWNCWLHRPLRSALRWTWFILADSPKNADWVRGVAMALRGARRVLARRSPIPADLDRAWRALEEGRIRSRRPFWTRGDDWARRDLPT